MERQDPARELAEERNSQGPASGSPPEATATTTAKVVREEERASARERDGVQRDKTRTPDNLRERREMLETSGARKGRRGRRESPSRRACDEYHSETMMAQFRSILSKKHECPSLLRDARQWRCPEEMLEFESPCARTNLQLKDASCTKERKSPREKGARSALECARRQEERDKLDRSRDMRDPTMRRLRSARQVPICDEGCAERASASARVIIAERIPHPDTASQEGPPALH